MSSAADPTAYSNYTVLTANTPAAIGGGAGVKIGKIFITSTLTGNLTLNDNASAASGPLIFAATTPAIGTIFDIRVKMRNGAWLVPGTAGTCTVSWE